MIFTRLLAPLPSFCAVCRSWGDQAVCMDCLTRDATPVPRCGRCALQGPAKVSTCGACLTTPPEFDAAQVGLHYQHPWSSLITRFKFHDCLDLTQALIAPLKRAIEQSDAPRPDWVLPVPLSPQRLRQRGYNQAWEVARRLAQTFGVKADPHLLLRLKDTPHQLDLPPDKRAANVKGVFAVEPLRRHEVLGRHVAVVDDVLTTGATLGEVARVLKQAGAARVDAWALARTPRPGD